MHIIDTHAHIYLPEFEGDLGAILQRAEEKEVGQILMPAIDSSTHQKMLEVEKRYYNCLAMIGLHPCSVNQEYKKELELIKNYLESRRFVAIGEIGLDYYWDRTFQDQQIEAFRQQLQWALAYDLPIAIHSRNATDECIDLVRQYPGLRGVFHCFSGTVEQAEAVMDTGFLMGVGGVVTFKNSGLDAVVKTVGLSSVILETDAPYLTPVPFRGKRNEPSYTRLIAEKLAALLDLPVEEIIKITTENAKKLFGL